MVSFIQRRPLETLYYYQHARIVIYDGLPLSRNFGLISGAKDAAKDPRSAMRDRAVFSKRDWNANSPVEFATMLHYTTLASNLSVDQPHLSACLRGNRAQRRWSIAHLVSSMARISSYYCSQHRSSRTICGEARGKHVNKLIHRRDRRQAESKQLVAW
jgi:hypothetical protein